MFAGNHSKWQNQFTNQLSNVFIPSPCSKVIRNILAGFMSIISGNVNGWTLFKIPEEREKHLLMCPGGKFFPDPCCNDQFDLVGGTIIKYPTQLFTSSYIWCTNNCPFYFCHSIRHAIQICSLAQGELTSNHTQKIQTGYPWSAGCRLHFRVVLCGRSMF